MTDVLSLKPGDILKTRMPIRLVRESQEIDKQKYIFGQRRYLEACIGGSPIWRGPHDTKLFYVGDVSMYLDKTFFSVLNMNQVFREYYLIRILYEGCIYFMPVENYKHDKLKLENRNIDFVLKFEEFFRVLE